MANILPPVSPGTPAVVDRQGKAMQFTLPWLKWFTDLAEIINRSGGTSGALPSTRQINTTTPLTGGGDLSTDRTIAFLQQAANTVLAGPPSGGAVSPVFRQLVAADLPAGGQTIVITLAKITAGGSNGSLTFTNGLLTAFTNPT